MIIIIIIIIIDPQSDGSSSMTSCSIVPRTNKNQLIAPP
jgi:hypothetical protein